MGRSGRRNRDRRFSNGQRSRTAGRGGRPVETSPGEKALRPALPDGQDETSRKNSSHKNEDVHGSQAMKKSVTRKKTSPAASPAKIPYGGFPRLALPIRPPYQPMLANRSDALP